MRCRVSAGRPVPLTRLEFDLLLYLVRRPRRVLSRRTLMAEVWGVEEPMNSRTVDVHIRRLRDKLGPAQHGLISTVRASATGATAVTASSSSLRRNGRWSDRRRRMADMSTLDTLLAALPITGVNVRFGSTGNCGGLMFVYIDVAAAPAYEFVNATPPDEDQELADFCVVHARDGIETELREHFGELPPVRVTLNRVSPHATDAAEWNNRGAGSAAVQEVLRRAGLGHLDFEYRGRVTIMPA